MVEKNSIDFVIDNGGSDKSDLLAGHERLVSVGSRISSKMV